MEDGGGFLEIGNRKMSLNFRQVMGHNWLVVMALTGGGIQSLQGKSQTFAWNTAKDELALAQSRNGSAQPNRC